MLVDVAYCITTAEIVHHIRSPHTTFDSRAAVLPLLLQVRLSSALLCCAASLTNGC